MHAEHRGRSSLVLRRHRQKCDPASALGSHQPSVPLRSSVFQLSAVDARISDRFFFFTTYQLATTAMSMQVSFLKAWSSCQ